MQKTIKEEVAALVRRKRPLSYEEITEEVQRRHPEAKTTVRTVMWYTSLIRRQGGEVRVRRANERRDWSKRPTEREKEAAKSRAGHTQSASRH